MSDKTPTTASPTTSRVDKAATPVTTTSATTSSTSAGKTVIADNVISKVAGIAAREVPGVYALGGGAARAFGAIRDVIGQQDLSQGVRVEVGETQVAADVTIVVEYPTPMNAVAEQVRSAVAEAITQLVGMEVAEINVAINDVHIPGDDDDNNTQQGTESRVA
jgi:uncharacterized alkaline shock family protein YloU